MKVALKIILLIILCLPIWLTIVAFAGPSAPDVAWRDALNAKLQAEKNRRVQILELMPARVVPSRDLIQETFSVELIDVRAQGISSLGVKVVDAEGRLQNYFRLPARLLVQERMAVAAQHIPANTTLTAEHFTIDWKEASSQRGSGVAGDGLVGRVTQKALTPGQVITEAQLKTFRLVERGSRVKVKVVGSGLTLTGSGVAREAGSAGDLIKVLNTDSKKEIVGRVIASNLVEVRL